MLRSLALAALVVFAGAVAAADNFSAQLKPFIGKPINLNEGGRYTSGVPLDRVGDDYFCVRIKMEDTGNEVPRCFPFANVKWFSPDERRPVVGIN